MQPWTEAAYSVVLFIQWFCAHWVGTEWLGVLSSHSIRALWEV